VKYFYFLPEDFLVKTVYRVITKLGYIRVTKRQAACMVDKSLWTIVLFTPIEPSIFNRYAKFEARYFLTNNAENCLSELLLPMKAIGHDFIGILEKFEMYARTHQENNNVFFINVHYWIDSFVFSTSCFSTKNGKALLRLAKERCFGYDTKANSPPNTPEIVNNISVLAPS